jgi:SET domain-containing protein
MSNGHGRLINHGAKDANLITKIVEVDNRPRLCFFAARVIGTGEELLYGVFKETAPTTNR